MSGKAGDGEDTPASVAAANARTAARAASMPQVDPNTIDPNDPAGLNRRGGPTVPASTPPAEPPKGGQAPSQTSRPPVRFVSAVPEETPKTPPNEGGGEPPKGEPEPSDPVARLTRDVEDIRRRLESPASPASPQQPSQPEFNIDEEFTRSVKGDPDIRACAQEFNKNVDDLKKYVEVDEETGQPIIIQGHFEGPLRELEFQLKAIDEQIKSGKGPGGIELDEDQIVNLKDAKRDLRDQYNEQRETVKRLHNRQGVLQNFYKRRTGEIRQDLERQAEEKDREAIEVQRQEEAERTFDRTLTELLKPFGITPESTPDAYQRQERKLGLMLSALRDESGKDFDDLAKAMKGVFDAEIAPDLAQVAGAQDAEAARQKVAEISQPHPPGSASTAGPGDTSKMSPRERRIAASTRTARLVRDVRMIGG